MDFAKKQLEKYGWQEGKGLGKNEDGIAKPLKPKLKFDNHGIGHDPAEHFTNNWWEQVYNKAASNVKVDNSSSSVKLKLNSSKSVNISTKQYLINNDKESLNVERGFIRKSKLTRNGLVDIEPKNNDILEAAVAPALHVLSDEELFAACNGRTAHKGARHGLKQSGKLSRIEKQEMLLLRKLRNVSLSDDECILRKKAKKVSKHKEKYQSTSVNPDIKKKKKKKNRRTVSFNETVTEYYSQEPDLTQQSGDSDSVSETVSVIVQSPIKDGNDNEINNHLPVADDLNGQDEGIEQDYDDEGTKNFGHASFEEQQVNPVEKLSKEERKLLKKKRKMERENRGGATVRFLEELDCIDLENIDVRIKRKKRKSKVLKNDDVTSETGHPNRKKNKKNRIQPEEGQINSIVQSLNQVCKISEME